MRYINRTALSTTFLSATFYPVTFCLRHICLANFELTTAARSIRLILYVARGVQKVGQHCIKSYVMKSNCSFAFHSNLIIHRRYYLQERAAQRTIGSAFGREDSRQQQCSLRLLEQLLSDEQEHRTEHESESRTAHHLLLQFQSTTITGQTSLNHCKGRIGSEIRLVSPL